MKIDFDPEKSKKNNHDRGLPFERVAEFDWETALFVLFILIMQIIPLKGIICIKTIKL